MKYYVEDSRRPVGNCMLWWRPEGKGYTTQIEEAGLYSAEQVKQMRSSDVGWPEPFVRKHLVGHVRRDRLKQADRPRTVKGKR